MPLSVAIRRYSKTAITTAMVSGLSALSCASSDYMSLYATAPLPPSLSSEDIATMDYMGATILDQGLNFCVYSENAERIELALFDDPEATQPTQQFAMERFGDLWNIYVEGLGLGQHYAFVAWGPNWQYDEQFYPYTVIGFNGDVDLDGNRYNPNKLLTDPYGKGYHRAHDWSRGMAATGPWRAESTYSAATKSVVVQSDYQWSDAETAWREQRQEDGVHDWNELIIYEVHVKGFTANTASEVDHPGTYMGFAEKAPYLADLGVTAVELLPVFQKDLTLGGYWGYSTIDYFTPEMSYSETYATTGDPYDVIDEFKAMVDTLHQNGLEVILDVVYNHTGEGGLWEDKVCWGFDAAEDCYEIDYTEVATIFSMRGLDNAAYYAVSDDGQRFYDHTGVGHDTRANHTPFRRLIMDSLHFWVEEMHVDGFRFDLAAVLGEEDQNYNTWNNTSTVLADIVNDPVLQQYNTRLIAEPWGFGSYDNYWILLGEYPTSANDPDYGWAEWNGAFRDWWRRFYNWDYRLNSYEYDAVGAWEVFNGTPYFFDDGRHPYHSINFVTVHDGYTLFDLFSFDSARNACSPINPVCCDDPWSVWCELEEPWNQSEKAWDDDWTKRQLMRNMYTALMISNGTPLLLGGDEWIRTQYGNNNAWSEGADNPANWFRWGEWLSDASYHRYRMRDFVREVIQLRKDLSYAFAPKDFDSAMPRSWKNQYNQDLSNDEWSGDIAMVHYYQGDGFDQPEIAVLLNGSDYDQTFQLPSGKTWGRVLDTQYYFDTPGTVWEVEGNTGGYFEDYPDADPYTSMNITRDTPIVLSGAEYTTKAQSIVVLVQQ